MELGEVGSLEERKEFLDQVSVNDSLDWRVSERENSPEAGDSKEDALVLLGEDQLDEVGEVFEFELHTLNQLDVLLVAELLLLSEGFAEFYALQLFFVRLRA